MAIAPLRVRYSHIRRLSNDLLRRNHVLTAPVDVRRIAKSCGAVIKEDDLGEGVSGILLRTKNNTPVIGVAKDQAPVRRRFTIAHELAHLLLHDGKEVHVDRLYRVNYRSDRPDDGLRVEEKEANAFAAELLMPVQFLDKEGDFLFDVADDDELQALAGKYEVSVEAMSWRLLNLYRFRSR